MRLVIPVAAGTLVAAASFASFAAEPLVDAAWLSQNLATDNLVVLDIRDPAEDGAAEPFPLGHVPGSIHVSYAKGGWRTTVDGIPGMLPPTADLQALIGGAGIGNDDHVVIVSHGTSSTDFGSAARVYWTFNVLGHEGVSILEGGFAAWTAAGLPVEAGESAEAPVPVAFKAEFQPGLVAGHEEVKEALADGSIPLVDARPTPQYTGEETPQNVGIAGTIPTATNLPHTALVSGGDVIDRSTLETHLASLDLSTDGEQIAFCNTGHWASVGWFLLSEVGGNDNVKLYDGSMVEWAKARGEEVEVGADRTLVQ